MLSMPGTGSPPGETWLNGIHFADPLLPIEPEDENGPAERPCTAIVAPKASSVALHHRILLTRSRFGDHIPDGEGKVGPAPRRRGRRGGGERRKRHSIGPAEGSPMVRRIVLLAVLTATLLFGQATRSLATTAYAAQASSAFTITGFFDLAGASIPKPADLRIEADAEVFDLLELASGAASADALVSVDVFGSDPLDLHTGIDDVNANLDTLGLRGLLPG